ncbi:MAG: glutamine amidotransferase [Candidatus Marinimicrobia bacterium]|nr:glutamine amidotransferase [Candidatus Neomarinimicrobiota bacterium]
METNILRQFSQNGAARILFCGDDDIHLAAIYLATIIVHAGYDLDYVPSALHFPAELDFQDYDLVILSDYPRERFDNEQLRRLNRAIRNGGALLMIGGWESFRGLNGEYLQSPLEDLLPVHLLEVDDRINYDQGILVFPDDPAQALNSGLDWERPPLIGGYNAFLPRKDSQVCLWGKKLHIRRQGERTDCRFDEDPIPLCVRAKAGKGRSTALAFDLAPHWIGGMVDWGRERRHIDFNGVFIEVGDLYVRFILNLLKTSLRETQSS